MSNVAHSRGSLSLHANRALGLGNVVPADSCESEALRLVIERARSGSTPGARDDTHHIALAVEGGGMRGVVSGGMCSALDQLGLIDSFDSIYGTSAGAVNTIYSAAGQASFGSTVYSDCMWHKEFIRPTRVLVGRPAMSLEYLLVTVAQGLKPLDIETAINGPIQPVFLTTCLTDGGRSVAFHDWANPEDMWRSLWASCSFPGVTGHPVEIDGEQFVDGTMTESIPFDTALARGATHVVVLHSRPLADRRSAPSSVRNLASRLFLKRYGKALVELEHGRSERYNDALVRLARLRDEGKAFSIAPIPGSFSPSQLDNRRSSILAGLAAGGQAAFSTLTGLEVVVPMVLHGYQGPEAP